MLLLGAALVPALAPVLFAPELWRLWIAYVVGTFVLLVIDAVGCALPGAVAGRVRPPERIYIGDRDPFALEIENLGRVAVEVRLHLDHDPELDLRHVDRVRVPGRSVAEVAGTIGAARRGEFAVDRLWLRWRGPLGLLARTKVVALDRKVPVVPNTRSVRAAALRFFTSPEFQTGLKVEQYLGDGSEFDSLREFQPGHDIRAIDWKATARHRRTMTREYRAERNHDVVFAIDTGRLMGEPIDGLSRLDHAINAFLLLGWCVLKTGDRAGLYAFDDRVRDFLRPSAGLATLHHLQRHASALEYGTGESNFTLALSNLRVQLRRRTLVVVVTEFADSTTAELMVENVLRLTRRHLVVFVALRDSELEAVANARPGETLDVHRSVVAGGMLRERRRVMVDLARRGVRCLDVRAAELSTRLVNEYLEIKRRELV
ncbi:MAG: DUF58 domain-containing protein [Planctomycetota bacterium]